MPKKKVTRRGNGEGSIYQRKSGQWAAVITVGVKADGKPNRKFLYGKTRAEVAQKLREAQNSKDLGVICTSGNVLYATYITDWLEKTVRPGVLDRATYKGYANYVYNHIIPGIGIYKLSQLTKDIIQAFLDKEAESGALNKVLDEETETLVTSSKGLSDWTVNGIRRLIIASLDVAVEERRIMSNPARKTKRTKTSGRNKMNIYNELERKEFAEKAVKYKYYAAYMLAFCTGCRRGEIIGLPWRNVYVGISWHEIDTTFPWEEIDALQLWDTDALAKLLEDRGIHLSDQSNIYVEQAVVENGRRPEIDEPKTELSKRRLYIPYDMALLLVFQRREQAKDRDRHVEKGRGKKEDYNREGLVFCTRRGGIIYPRNFSKIYASNLASMGLKHTRFHDLRHMVATILLEEGESANAVQEQLGHYDAGFTASRYGHVTEKMRKQTRDQLSGSLQAARQTSAVAPTNKLEAMEAYINTVDSDTKDDLDTEIERTKSFMEEMSKNGFNTSYMVDYLDFLERKKENDNISNVNSIGLTAARKKS